MLTLVEFFFICFVYVVTVKPNFFARQKNNGQLCESILVCVNLNQVI